MSAVALEGYNSLESRAMTIERNREEILRIVARRGEAAFLVCRMRRDAVIRKLEIIGEAVWATPCSTNVVESEPCQAEWRAA